MAAVDHTPADPSVAMQLEELQKKYKIMENDRKSYADEVANVLKKQKAQLDKLKRDNSQLKQDVKLSSRAPTDGESGPLALQLAKIQDEIDQTLQDTEHERRRSQALDQRLKLVRDGAMQERKHMGGVHGPVEHDATIAKQVKVLEHRLHRSLIKFNETISSNKELREEIDNLRRERVIFDNVYAKTQGELQKKKQQMAEVIESANISYELRDRAQADIASVKDTMLSEQAIFEDEWKELGIQLEEDRKRQELLARERVKALNVTKRGEMTVEQETSMKKVVSRGNWQLAKDKAIIQSGLEKVESYEQAFQSIQEATGIGDVDELVATFIASEEENFKMFSQLEELNAELEKSENALSEQRQESDRVRGHEKGSATQKKRLLNDMQTRMAEIEKRCAQYDESIKQLSTTIGMVARILESTTNGSQMLQIMGAEGGCTENNINLYLGVAEQMVDELYRASSGTYQMSTSFLTTGESNEELPNMGTAQRTGSVSIAVPTTASIFDSDDSDDENEIPLSRDELQAKTLRGISRREGRPPKASPSQRRRSVYKSK